ncbi:MAG: hypothetical protein JSV34_02310, partial [Candidatus Omnitrophota bacterium]
KMGFTRSFNVPANGTATVKFDFRADKPKVKLGRNSIRAWVEPAPHQADIEKAPSADHDVAYLEVKEKAKAKPNFVIEGRVNPKYIEQPGDISIWFVIFNKGAKGSDSPPTKAVLYINDSKIKEFSIKSLSPWIEPAEFEYKYNLTKGGKYNIKVVVDEANSIKETKEDDNTFEYRAVLDEYIDFVVGDLGIPTNTVQKEDGYVLVTPTVVNKGSVKGDAVLSLFLDGNQVFGKTFSVEPNSSHSWPRKVKVEVEGVGDHTLTAKVVVYSHHEKLERNRGDNDKNYYIKILHPPLPYLKLAMMNYGPPSVYLGEKVKATFRVTNVGKGRSPSTFVRMLINNNVERDFKVKALNPGSIQEFKHEAVTDRVGACDVKIIVNREGKDVRQSGVKYDHTGFTSEVKAEREIDFDVGKIEISNKTPKAKETITVRAPVMNKGNVSGSANLEIKFGKRRVYADLATIGAGATVPAVKRFSVGSAPGKYKIYVGAEVARAQKDLESILDNNSKETEIEVKGEDVIDLAAEEIKIIRIRPKEGEIKLKGGFFNLEKDDLVLVSVKVSNKGNVADTLTMKINFGSEEFTDTARISANDTMSGGQRFRVKDTGEFIIKVGFEPSPEKKHLEKNVKNNYKEVKVRVKQIIDLAITELSVPSPLYENEEFKVKAVVWNYGNTPAQARLRLVIDRHNYLGIETFTVAADSSFVFEDIPSKWKEALSKEKRFRTAKAGSHRLWAEVILEAPAVELKEKLDNNFKQTQININPLRKASLSVRKNKIDSKFNTPFDTVNVNFSVFNTSSITSPKTKAVIYVNGKEIKTFDNVRVNPGRRQDFRYYISLDKLKKGTDNIIEVKVDPADLLLEDNKEDNVIKATLKCPAFVVDLAVDEIKVSTLKPQDGQQVTIDVPVTNYGDYGCRSRLEVKYDGKVILSKSVSFPLHTKPPVTKSFQMTQKAEGAGSHTISAVITPDTKYEKQETNSANNSKEVTVEAVVSAVVIDSITPKEAKVGDKLVLKGKNLLGKDIVVKFEGAETKNVGKFPKGLMLNMRVPQGVKSGKMYVAIDGKKSNKVDFKIVEEKYIDLEIVDVGVEKVTVEEAEKVVFSPTIRNNGNVTAGPIEVKFVVPKSREKFLVLKIAELKPEASLKTKPGRLEIGMIGYHKVEVKVELVSAEQKKLESKKYQNNNTKRVRIRVKEDVPVINSIVPKEASVGDIVVLRGKNLYLKHGGGMKVKFQGAYAKHVGAMSPEGVELKVEVPKGAKSGKVIAVKNGEESNAVDFILKGEERINLEMRALKLTNYTPGKMETVRLTAKIYNAGDSAVNGVKWVFDMQDHYKVTYDVKEKIPAKRAKIVTTAFLARKEGKYKIRVEVVPPRGKANAAVEANTYKECYVTTGEVKSEAIDLVIEKSNSTPEDEEEITVDVGVINYEEDVVAEILR